MDYFPFSLGVKDFMPLRELSTSDSIIFDLDGTLWDASVSCAAAWNNALTAVGYGNHTVTINDVKSFSGINIETVLAGYFIFVPVERHQALLDHYKASEAKEMSTTGGFLYPHVGDVLMELKKTKRLFIVSNCLQGYIENFIRRNHFDSLFDGFKSSGGTGKPKNDNIRDTIVEYNLCQPIYVGDTAHDEDACKSNNIPFVYAAYGFGKVTNPKYPIKYFSDLLHIIE